MKYIWFIFTFLLTYGMDSIDHKLSKNNLPLFIEETPEASVFWKVSNPTTKQELFILGTVHEAPEFIAEYYAQQLKPHVQDCESFYVEHQLPKFPTFESNLMSHFTTKDFDVLESKSEWFETHSKVPSFFGITMEELWESSFEQIRDDSRQQYFEINEYHKKQCLGFASGDLQEFISAVLDGKNFEDQLKGLLATGLLYERNDLWVSKIENLVLTNSFIAVGAAHVYFKNGILDLLHQNNWKMESIKIESLETTEMKKNDKNISY